MQTPKQRPLLPTARPPEYLRAVMFTAKSLFHKTFRVTHTPARSYAETVRNSMITRIRGGGGGIPGWPTHSRVGNACFSRNLKLETRNSLVGILVLLMTTAAIAQQPITDPDKLDRQSTRLNSSHLGIS